jgi:hypothetical protein
VTITGTSGALIATTPLALTVGAAEAITSTTLTVTSAGAPVASMASGSAVTLTAAVSAGSTPLTAGQIRFCDAAAVYCEDAHLLGTAQLTSAGTAVLKFIPGMGSHSYKAVFAGAQSNGGSSSNPAALTVTAAIASTTTIAQSGASGNYTLTATVMAQGLLSPTGNISFQDTSSGNAPVGTAALGQGKTALSWLASSSAATGSSPYAIATGDFNGDGIPDLAAANYSGNTVTILLGKGDGTFTATAVSPPTGSYPGSVAVADFNGDGIPDLAVANENSNTMTILLGGGDGTFTQSASPSTGNEPDSIAVGDFNGDGIPDMAVANEYSNNVTILLGNGDGTFTQSASPAVGSYPRSVATGDFNGDGIPDLAVASELNTSIAILLGNGDGTFTASPTSPLAGSDPSSIVIGDFNEDGIKDLAVANESSDTVTILLGNGNGTFTPAASPTTGYEPASIAAGDFNGDGKVDLAVSNYLSNSVTLLLGNGDGTFTAAATQSTGIEPWGIVAAPFTRTGSPGLAVANYGSNTITVLSAQLTQTATATASSVSPVGHGIHLVDAMYPGDSSYSSSVSATTGLTALPIAPGVMVTPSSSSITTAQALTVTAAVGGGNGNPTPTGSVTLTSGSYTSAPATLSNGAAIINIPAGSLALGADILAASYTPDSNSSSTYNHSTGSNSVTVTALATPTITWVTPAAITYGTALAAAQLNASSTVAGTFAYSPAMGTALAAGQQSLTATFTPADTTSYTTATASVTLTVNKATPTITWVTPAAITYGTALAAAQLNASSTVAGTFAYSPALGTALGAGQQTPAAIFTPTDTTDYTTATASVTLTVNKATPTIAWAGPAAITVGTALGNSQLDATSSVAGSFVYSPAAGTVLSVGTQTLSVTFTPNDPTDYAVVINTVPMVVTNRAVPTITWTNPAAITYGTALSSAQLDATASVPGTFAYTPALGAVLPAGTQTLSVTFTPTDAAGYSPAAAAVQIVVGKATPTTTWATLTPIVYGTALSAAQLDATASVPGTLVYNPVAGTVLSAGTQTLQVTITPADTADYTTATTTATLTVNKATPAIAWANPAPIVYGTALGTTQLDATASLPGTFVYSPAAGAVLSAGTQTLSVTSTPADTTDYTTAAGTTALTVAAPPGIAINGSAVSIGSPGATTGNTGTITVTPSGGFTGIVSLIASITSSPGGAQDLPTLSLSPSSTINITGATAGTATLTISSTAPVRASLAQPKLHEAPWYAAGGAAGSAAACFMLFGIPDRRRRWRAILGMLALSAALAGGIIGCGGGGSSGNDSGGVANPGTTAGTYSVTVTGTSGTTTASGIVTVIVQ